MRVGWNGSLRVILFAACVGQACIIEECDQDCDPATEDCSLSPTCCTPPGAPTPVPPPPVALSCEDEGSSGSDFFTLRMTIVNGQPPFRWNVDFGDSHASQGTHNGSPVVPGVAPLPAYVSADHRYTELPGQEEVVYTVRGTVTDARNQSQTCSVTHTVDPQRLDIDCEVAPRAGVVPLTVTFDARTSGCIGNCTVVWDFGDGESFTGRHAVHTYTTPGVNSQQTHPARGTVTDSEGRSQYCPRAVQVFPAGSPGPSPSPSASPTPTPTPTPGPNSPPVIVSYTVVPNEILANGPPAQVSATITDPDGNPVTWSLTVATGSQASGTFLPAAGTGGAVAAQFFAAGPPFGTAMLRLTAVDSLGASTQATVPVFVFAPN